jgi:hypothetical protein
MVMRVTVPLQMLLKKSTPGQLRQHFRSEGECVIVLRMLIPAHQMLNGK